MSKKTSISEFKEVLRQGMIKNFQMAGYLTPIMFFYKAGQPIITEIPDTFLVNSIGKVQLANIIKKICGEPDTLMAGMIIEAYGAKLDGENATEETEAVLSGEKRVKDIEGRQDIIIMISSTPEGEETISYVVDPETKTVGEEFAGAGADQVAGTCSHFFNWKRTKTKRQPLWLKGIPNTTKIRYTLNLILFDIT